MADTLTDAEHAALAEIAALIIPASEARGLPGADDPAILAEIAAAAGARRGALAGALAAFAGLDGSGPAKGEAFRAAHPGAATILQTLVAEAYYRDERVLTALGHPPRPPFQQGYEVRQGDWSLLDPVRARPAIWRSVE